MDIKTIIGGEVSEGNVSVQDNYVTGNGVYRGGFGGGIAVSYKSTEQAKAWLDAEIPAFDYVKVRETAKLAWNNMLNKIDIKGGTVKEKTIFYSAMYHAHLLPHNRTNDIWTNKPGSQDRNAKFGGRRFFCFFGTA